MSALSKPDQSVWNRHAVLTCDEMRRAEDLSVRRGTHSFFDLMLVAGRAVAQAVMDRFGPSLRVLVLCGTGNNGGDGYVAAEALRQAGWSVRVCTLGQPAAQEAVQAAARWSGETRAFAPLMLDETDIVIDALFGTGLTRPLDGEAARMVREVNARALPVIAADMPSGINGDTGAVMGCAFQALCTVTFFRKKRAHVLLPAMVLCGEVVVADTGMYADVLDQINPQCFQNDSELWSALHPKPELQNHKYHRGHALVFGGAELTGAARLAARAAQRMGAGLITLAAPKEAWEVYARALESVMVRRWESMEMARELLADKKINALLLGPGLGRQEDKKELVLAALATRKPCVLDADALMLFAQESSILFASLHENCVLTPHQGEFSRLFGALCAENDDKITNTRGVSGRIGCVLLHKGADTVISDPSGKTVINTNAPPWLATAGAGDVLAGMIAGLMAAGMPVFEAACCACFYHAAAARRFGEGLIAEDLVETIPALLQERYG